MKKKFVFLIAMLIFSGVLFLSENNFARAATAKKVNQYDSDFSIEMIPEEPLPGQAISAKLISYQFDVDRSQIEWIFDGKTFNKGLGKKTANFILPSLGKESILTINVITPNGEDISKTKKFSGSDLDFLWQAGTSVPAGYKGKALAVKKAFVKITALPHLYTASALNSRSSLVYEWTLNYKNLPEDSGVDKNTFLLRLDDSGDYVIGVKVSTQDRKAVAQKFLHLSAESALEEAVLYKDDPMEGPFYGKSLSDEFAMKTKDINIRAEPYFFNQGNGETVYSWNMNGQPIKAGRKPNIISLVSGDGSGSAAINFKMEKDTANWLQSAESEVKIAF